MRKVYHFFFNYQDVGVRSDSGHGASHVGVEVVDLLRVECLVQQLVGVSAFGGKDDAVVGQHAKTGAGVTNSLHGIFDL